MNCMKCGNPVAAQATECATCGVILAKARPPLPAVPTGGPLSGPAPSDAPVLVPAPQGAAPVAPDLPERSFHVGAQTASALTSARPWLKFVVIYGYVVTVIMFLASLGFAIYSFSNPGVLVLAFVYALYGMLSLILLTPLQRSSAAIKNLNVATIESSLELFVQEQCSFWRKAGILTAVTLAIAIVGAALLLFAGAIVALRNARF